MAWRFTAYWALGPETDVDSPWRRTGLNDDSRRALEDSDLDRGDLPGKIDLAVLKSSDPSRRLWDGAPDHPVDADLATPIGGVGFEHDAVTAGPVGNSVRASADRL